MQSLPLEAKIKMSERRIIEWYEHWDGQVYVSRSGGKDSDVLGDLVKKLYPDVPQVFVNTGLEFDSVRRHGTEVADVVRRPEMSFIEVVTKYGYPIISKDVAQNIFDTRNYCKLNNVEIRESKPYQRRFCKDSDYLKKYPAYSLEKYDFLFDAPFRISHRCCTYTKKAPAKQYEKETGQKPFIGTMATESRIRKTKWMLNGCNAFESDRPTSQPLSFWTEQDILQYILKYNIPIADAYGDVAYMDEDGMYYTGSWFADSMNLTTTKFKRTGCVFCMFGITQNKDNFLKLKELEPQKYDYVMRGGKFDEEGMWIPHQGLGYKFVIDWLNEHGNLGIEY